MEKEPDYRFSLADERAFLAWIRTALGTAAVSVTVRGVAVLLLLSQAMAAIRGYCRPFFAAPVERVG